MGIWNKFKDFVNMPEPDYDEDDETVEEETAEEEEIAAPKPKKRRQTDERKTAFSSKSFDYNIEEFDKRPSAVSRPSYRNTSPSGKVVDIHTTAKLQVVLTKPEKFSDAKDIANELIEKRTVVLNLESTNKEEALRLLDFLSGVAFANDGEIKKIAQSTFIITPYNVDVMGDLLYELESNGVYFV